MAGPGLINHGSVIDRAERPGGAISLDSAYTSTRPLTRYTWIFDRHTGKLLGDEETLISHTTDSTLAMDRCSPPPRS